MYSSGYGNTPSESQTAATNAPTTTNVRELISSGPLFHNRLVTTWTKQCEGLALRPGRDGRDLVVEPAVPLVYLGEARGAGLNAAVHPVPGQLPWPDLPAPRTPRSG